MYLDRLITAYYEMGFCLIPIKPKTKIAAVAWKKYQNARPSLDETLQLFSASEYFNVACLCGAVSGGLVVIDLDIAEAVGEFKRQFPDLYSRCPIVKTNRGQHIYVRSIEPVKTAKLDKVDIIPFIKSNCA